MMGAFVIVTLTFLRTVMAVVLVLVLVLVVAVAVTHTKIAVIMSKSTRQQSLPASVVFNNFKDFLLKFY